MRSHSAKPTRLRRAAISPGRTNQYSCNPIINRFLQLTIEEGQSVRGVSLTHSTITEKTVVFSLGDGSSRTLTPDQESGAFMTLWKDASDFVKRLRSVDLSPAF